MRASPLPADGVAPGVPADTVPAVDYAAPGELVPGEEGTFTLGDFEFECGATLHGLRIGYVTHGRLNAARDNAVLLLPGTANTRHSADGYIGPGNAFDPDRHFVIATDAIGAGTSSSPADGLADGFPRYVVRDMVRAVHALVTRHFGIGRLAVVAGASMGAFQSLEWAIRFPDAAARAMLFVPAWRASGVFRLAVDAAIATIALDPDWQAGRYARPPRAGLRGAGRLYYPWTVTDAWLESRPAQAIDRELEGTIERAAQWDAWSYVRRYQASAAHDVTVPFGGDLAAALSRVRMPVLVMPSATDRLLPVAGAREIARGLRHATYAEIPGDRGHLAWRAVPGSPETRFVVDHVLRFLEMPA
jgi:homoserine O-acetyltransferase